MILSKDSRGLNKLEFHFNDDEELKLLEET